MDVVEAAWRAAGEPMPDLEFTHEGHCARCTREGPAARADRVVSPKFTGHDSWHRPDGQLLCRPCSWAYRERVLRDRPHAVSHSPAHLEQLSLPALCARLRRGPLNAGEAITAPLRAARRHVLPAAAWGQVCVDGSTIPWTQHDAQLLEVVAELRQLGFSYRAVPLPSPPWPVLSKLTSTQQARVLAHWRTLSVWREPSKSLWLRLALLATTDEGKA